MSRWFPDVTSEKGAREAVENGAGAGVLFALPLVYVLGFLALRGSAPGISEELPPQVVAWLALELAFIVICSWCFTLGRGVIIGVLAILLCLFDMALLFRTGIPAGFILFYGGFIILGYVNGIRGSLAFGRLHKQAMAAVPESPGPAAT